MNVISFFALIYAILFIGVGLIYQDSKKVKFLIQKENKTYKLLSTKGSDRVKSYKNIGVILILAGLALIAKLLVAHFSSIWM